MLRLLKWKESPTFHVGWMLFPWNFGVFFFIVLLRDYNDEIVTLQCLLLSFVCRRQSKSRWWWHVTSNSGKMHWKFLNVSHLMLKFLLPLFLFQQLTWSWFSLKRFGSRGNTLASRVKIRWLWLVLCSWGIGKKPFFLIAVKKIADMLIKWRSERYCGCIVMIIRITTN